MRIEIQEKGDLALLLTVLITPEYRRRFIVGQDSQSAPPFVTQVPRWVENLKEGFEWMKPKIVQQAEAAGLVVKRQGDFFFIPCEPPTGPSYRPMRRIFVEALYEDLVKMREGKWEDEEVKLEPNVLYRNSYGPIATRHTATEVVRRSTCRDLVRGTVEAPDHAPLDLGEQWHVAVRRRSVAYGVGTARRRDD